MTPQQIVGMSVRLLAIFVALSSIPLFFNNFKIYYAIGGVCIFVAVLLWFFPMVIAHGIIPRARFENHVNVQALDVARVGSSLIGLWLLANVLPNFLWFIFSISGNTAGEQSFIRSIDLKDRLLLAYYLVKLAVAFFLIFQSHLFAKIAIRKIAENRDESQA